MTKGYINRAVEKLIREADFFPVTKDVVSASSTGQNNVVLKKVIGKKARVLEIYNCDLLGAQEIISDIFSYKRKTEELGESIDVSYIKVLIFSEKPPDSLVKDINNAYSERIEEKNDTVCMAISLKDREVFIAKGIVYPYHIIYDAFTKEFKEADENYEVDIVKVLEEKKAENKPEIIVENQEQYIFDTFCFRFSVVYFLFF